MTASPDSSAVRAFAGLQCLGGAVLLSRPGAVAAAVSPGPVVPPSWLVRLLGARQLAQGVTGLVWPSRRIVLAGAAVDLTHALSMLAVAACAPHYRRPALISAASAAGAAAVAAATMSPTR